VFDDQERTPSDRVLRSTRVLAAAIVPFLVLAFMVLVPWPTDTRRLFAWEIKPTMSAMVLGSVYLGGAYFFVRVVWASRWHTVARGFIPVTIFATSFVICGSTAGAGLLGDDRPAAAALSLWSAGRRRTCGCSSPCFRRVGGHLAVASDPSDGANVGCDLRARHGRCRCLVRTAFECGADPAAGRGLHARSQFDTFDPLTWLFLVGFVLTTVALVALYLRMGSQSSPRQVMTPRVQ
jgi:hypothetical protein